MIATLALVRDDWEAGHRRLERASRDVDQAATLAAQVDLISAELRRRVGSTFTLEMLAEAYVGADVWVRQAIEEQAPTPGWARTIAMAGDAAFHIYSRGAVDYAP
ncbi:hypothetical protein [Gaiella sp.]|uniref:hypothetical protein n=1 Tax=Gaiella sp. TaxID=2663207 RepID=UPI003983CB2A